ncbi:LIC_13387 family protein [Streptomyces sp. 1268]|uniref:LIC_13387 family protein n=1 Tax=Streptomyces sp. 1268 TaxID=3231942 RepID=UPI0038D355E8
MNTAIAARTSTGSDPVRPFRIGAYGFVVLGVGHLAFVVATASATPTPEQRRADTAMRESTFTLLGLERTTLDVTHGMSIAMAFFVVACGLLMLAAVRHAPDLVRRRTAFGRVSLVASLAALGLALLLLPAPPIVILPVTSYAFALSLRRGAKV